MKYNMAVRRNILLQEMTSLVNLENSELLAEWEGILSLMETSTDEVTAAYVDIMKDQIRKSVLRANKVRDALNDFFDESGEMDEDRYLLFKGFELPEYEGDVERVDSSEESDSSVLEEEFSYDNQPESSGDFVSDENGIDEQSVDDSEALADDTVDAVEGIDDEYFGDDDDLVVEETVDVSDNDVDAMLAEAVTHENVERLSSELSMPGDVELSNW